MKLQLEGWVGWAQENEPGISKVKKDTFMGYASLSRVIMSFLGWTPMLESLGGKITFLQDVNLECWFSDKECTLEEAQKNSENHLVTTGGTAIIGHYVNHLYQTTIGFELDHFMIGKYELTGELFKHLGEYIHLILTY